MMVGIAFFAMIAAIVIVPQYLRYKDRQRLHETLRQTLAQGQTVPPELVSSLTAGRPVNLDTAPASYAYPPADRAHRDLRRGLVWLSVGLGFCLIGLAFYAGLYNDGGAPEAFSAFAAFGAIPACIGLAFLGLWWFGRKDPV